LNFLLVLPTLNEVDNAPNLISEVLLTFDNLDVLVIDDGSSDGTVEKIISTCIVYSKNRINFLERKTKLGLAKAYVDGFNWAIKNEYDAVISMDSDGSHRFLDLKCLVCEFTKSESVDLLIGSRWINGGSVKNWSFKRMLLSRCANFLINAYLVKDIKDVTSGFRISRVSSLKTISMKDFESKGFIFQVELTLNFVRNGFSILEYPIHFEERAAGKSKLNMKIVFEALQMISKWSVREFKRRATLNKEFS
jgi:glycosyltransferase involved in cell wall biosynthesis